MGPVPFDGTAPLYAGGWTHASLSRRNFEVFTPTDFLAAITRHIPDKAAQMVRYYGWYSNKMRGVRQRGLPAELVFRRPGVSPPPPLKLPSKRWRDLTCPAVASAKVDSSRLAR